MNGQISCLLITVDNFHDELYKGNDRNFKSIFLKIAKYIFLLDVLVPRFWFGIYLIF